MISLRSVSTRFLTLGNSYSHACKRLLSTSRHQKFNYNDTDFNSGSGEDFDANMYRNDAYITGKTITDPMPLRNTESQEVFGYEFTMDIANAKQSPIHCSIKVYEKENPSSMEYIVNNIKNNQEIKVKGFFRKYVRVRMNDFTGEKEFTDFFSVGPKSIVILKQEIEESLEDTEYEI